MEVVVKTRAIRHAKFQLNHHYQHLTFYSLDVLPVVQPTVSKHCRKLLEWQDKWRTCVFLGLATCPILRGRGTSVTKISWDPLHARYE